MGRSPITIQVTRYKCPHCRRTWAKRWAAGMHVLRCFKNPEARSCKTCAAHQLPEPPEFHTGYPGCNEGCDAGHSLKDGLRINCPDWESAKPVSEYPPQ